MTRRASASATDKAQARKELAERLQATIADKVQGLTATDQWAQFLQQAAAFHSYSFTNVLLIVAQHPTATAVAGYNQWLERGRHVRAGEKAVRIYGFSSKKITEEDPTTGDEVTRKAVRFPILSVFAEDQTDPNTELTPRMLKANPKAALWDDVDHNPTQHLTGDDPANIYTRIAAILTAKGWSITREPIPGDTNGYTTIDGSHRIVIDDQLSDAQAAKTMIHEAAHALLHTDVDPDDQPSLHRGIWEVEAESVAYVLAGLLGLDTSAYSIGYIAGWANADTELITATGKRVLTTVHTLADALDKQDTTDTDAGDHTEAA